MGKRKGFKLRIILGLLVVSSVLLTAAAGGYLALSSNLKSLSANYLDSNYQYAKKLASNTTDMLDLMQDNMDSLAERATEEGFSRRDIEIWFAANEQYFNSVLIADKERKIHYVLPDQTYSLEGSQLTSEASLEAVNRKVPMISTPYVATTGRLILLVSSPIFNDKGEYAGFAGGTIYLQEDNVLSRILNEHFYGNGSYVYVTDDSSRLIFHPDSRRVNELIAGNEVVASGLSGKTGAVRVTNSLGRDFFAGYAYEPRGNWVIVSQTPVAVLDKPLQKLAGELLLQALPVCLIILIAAWRVSRYISAPLYELAKYSENAVNSKNPISPEMPKIASLIYEVKQLHQSIGNHLNVLNDEIQIDGLTGLANRKTFDIRLNEWIKERKPFALVLMDVDFFKRVNDVHGHMNGDEVLKRLAVLMQSSVREEDLCFRYGGEEFGILLKGGNLDESLKIAESLRKKVAADKGANGIPITISLGISVYSGEDYLSGSSLIEQADIALYRSKLEGRDRLTVYTTSV